MNSEEKIEAQVRMANLEKKMADVSRTIARLEADLQSIQQQMLGHLMELYQQALDDSKREDGADTTIPGS
ncbi:hypothetical protein GCM10023187_13890 [Nibrella viscosa]|uniref:SlyX protein n=1 Tax=Nibrella viscosa TaxID=1084524 RepID=A0ABP8K563_9BACT